MNILQTIKNPQNTTNQQQTTLPGVVSPVSSSVVASPATQQQPAQQPSVVPQQSCQIGWVLAPGFSILAIQAPPAADGTPGEIDFGPGLTLLDKRRVAEDLALWDTGFRKRGRMKSK